MPDRAAVKVAGRYVSYRDLWRLAASIAATIQQRTPAGGSPMGAVFADRSLTSFAGVLATLLAGRGYVPLNPHFPAARTSQMLRRADCRALVVDSSAEAHLQSVLDGADRTLVIVPDRSDLADLVQRFPQHVFVGLSGLENSESWRPASPPTDAIAYLLFTSGSTGTPKGVMVTHANAVHFIRTAVERYGISAKDRLSQTFDTTFDLSVFDMFVAWHEGGCVYCPSRDAMWNPASFIKANELTVWFSVPTVVLMMKRLGALRPGQFPSLRWSLFCGERLPLDAAEAWAVAAPKSVVENLYGPTELTVACTAYRWDPARSRAEAELSTVPIGFPLPGMECAVVDEQMSEVPPGEVGELLMTGPQRTPGYWRDPAATAKAYVKVPGRQDIFYRTGDRVRRGTTEVPLTFLGRVDHQVKIRGHRVELGEVESTLLQCPGVEVAAAVAWRSTEADVLGIAAFVCGRELQPAVLRSLLQGALQECAIPEAIYVLPNLPVNANGKVDRLALLSFLGR